MQALEFWRAVTRDRADVLGQLTRSLAEAGARYCVAGGHAVNAYVEPVVSLDLDLVVSQEDMPRFLERLGGSFKLESFADSINLSLPVPTSGCSFRPIPGTQASWPARNRATYSV